MIHPDRLRRFLADERHVMLLAFDDGRVVGQARGIVHLRPDHPDELYIDNLGVTPALQRRGVGRRLVDELLAWGRERGCAYAWLGTEPDNVPALALYASRGGRSTSMIMIDFDPL